MIKNLIKKTFINNIYVYFKFKAFKYKWRKKNKDNKTTVISFFNEDLVSVGKESYGDLNIISYSDDNKLKIGNFVSIAPEVTFLLNAEHKVNTISTYPFKVKYLMTEKSEATGKGDIIIDDDVWIGYRSTIMSGVHVGKGTVIAAGSVVTKNTPPYSIVGGVPAKVIKYRFNKDIIEKLMDFNFSKLDKNIVKNNIDLFYNKIESANDVDNIKNYYKV